jgi:hypothetical protein
VPPHPRPASGRLGTPSSVPRCGSRCPAGRPWLHLGTRPRIRSGAGSRSTCPARARAAPSSPGQRSFFKRLLRSGIAQRVLRAHRQTGEAEPAQHLAHQGTHRDRTIAMGPEQRSCISTSKRSLSSACRSSRRQRTTPSRSGSGPCSTTAASSACCSGVRRGLRPDRRRPYRPARPSSLYRCTQSPSVCRSIPACRAAASREDPSSTSEGQHPPRRGHVPAAHRPPPQLARAQLAAGDRERHHALPRPRFTGQGTAEAALGSHKPDASGV